MVEVKYRGRLGNNLFQYCFGRILAENLGYRLKADPIPGFPNTGKSVDGADYSAYPVQVILGEEPDIIKRQKVDICAIVDDKTKRKIVVDGFFQRYEYYRPYKYRIKDEWLLTGDLPEEKPGRDDIVIHIRRGDYIFKGHALPFSFYEEALRRAEFDKVFICTDFPDDPFLGLFKKYRPVVHHSRGEPSKDLRFIMSFNKMVQSMSSFSWWASFLSGAGEVYTPLPTFGYWNEGYLGIDLKVSDESRYIYIKCDEAYKGPLLEKLWSGITILRERYGI